MAKKGMHQADFELMFPCESCGQRIGTGMMICPGSVDTSLVGTLIECTHCGHTNAIELDHIWRAHNAAADQMKGGSG